MGITIKTTEQQFLEDFLWQNNWLKNNAVSQVFTNIIFSLSSTEKYKEASFALHKWKKLNYSSYVWKLPKKLLSYFSATPPKRLIKNHFSILNLPKEITKIIFGFLKPKELAKMCLTCKQWNQIGSDKALWNKFDMEKYFPGIFLEEAWKKYLDISITFPDYQKRKLFPILYSRCPFSNKFVYETHILVLLPAELTIENLKKYFEGKYNPEKDFWVPINTLKNIPAKSCRFTLITKTILEETRNFPLQTICENFERKYKEIDYKVPDLISLIVSLLFRQMSKNPENLQSFVNDLNDMEKSKYELATKAFNLLENYLRLRLSIKNIAYFKLNQLYSFCKEESEIEDNIFSMKIFEVGGNFVEGIAIHPSLEEANKKTGIAPMRDLYSCLVDKIT